MNEIGYLPVCCQDCQNAEWDYSEWYNQIYWYCSKNIWWPYKKQTCKARKPSNLVLHAMEDQAIDRSGH